MRTASQLAQTHWNETPLFLSENERYRAYPWLYEAAEFTKHRGHKVLEVGCGSGSDLLQFAKHGAVAAGIDITESHLRLAKERVGNLAEVKYGDARQIPYEDATFDYVYSHGVLHHSDEPKKIASEIMRVLKPGGRFNIQVYSLISYPTLYGTVRFGYKNWKSHHIENSESPVYVKLYTGLQLRSLFAGMGVPIHIEKRQFPVWRKLESLLGWFLIAKGQKPSSSLLG